MKVLLINGSPHQHGCTYTALAEIAAQLEKDGVDAEIFWIGNKPIGGCIACGGCRKGNGCVLGDAVVNDCQQKLSAADGVIVGAPVHYAGPAANLCALLDRVFYSKPASYAGKLGAAIVSCRRGGASASFDRLNKYFTISSMPIVSSQYWNSVHGNTPDEVRQDLEGLQTMRVLADQMAWLLKCIEAGRAAGITMPAPEAKIATNFIR